MRPVKEDYGHTAAVKSAPREAVDEAVFRDTLPHLSPTVRAMLESDVVHTVLA